MKIIRPATASILGTLLICGVAMQVAILLGRSASSENPVAVAAFLEGDTLVEFTGLAVDGSGDVFEIRMPPGTATVVYAFSSECVFCDDVAPDWATHFRTTRPEHVRRIAITRDGPDVAASYADRFGWDVRIVSMPNLAQTDRRSFFLSRTPWLYVFDHRGVLQFQDHGSSLDRAEEVTLDLAHPRGKRNLVASKIGGL